MYNRREDGIDYAFVTQFDFYFSINDNLHELELRRAEGFGSYNSSTITLLVNNKGQSTQKVNIGVSTPGLDYNGLFIYLEKLLSNNALFYFRTNALFTESSQFLPISHAYNATYKFIDNKYPLKSINNQADANYYAEMEGGSKVYFVYSTSNNYKFSYIVDSQGVKSSTSAIYGDLFYKYDSVAGKYKLYKGTTDLSETVIVPADSQVVTNYTYDPGTGLLSFDYKINIQALRSQNTTKHAIEITGSVSAKVYDSKIMRLSQE